MISTEISHFNGQTETDAETVSPTLIHRTGRFCHFGSSNCSIHVPTFLFFSPPFHFWLFMGPTWTEVHVPNTVAISSKLNISILKLSIYLRKKEVSINVHINLLTGLLFFFGVGNLISIVIERTSCTITQVRPQYILLFTIYIVICIQIFVQLELLFLLAYQQM